MLIRYYQTIVLLLLSILSNPLIAQTRIVTVGNTADAEPAFFNALGEFLAQADPSTVLIVNGDLSDNKCRERHDHHDYTNVDRLLDVIEANPHVESYLLPGDRDWAQTGKLGWECVLDLEDHIEDRNIDNVHWTMDQGCPGPDVEHLSASTVMITINTQWWNHPYRKPTPADAVCKYSEPAIVLEEMHDAVEENLDKNILLVGHFPLKSQGRYGGEYPLRDYFAPPLFGSLKVAYRQNIGSPEEIYNEQYEPFLDELKEIASLSEGILFLAGHEPNQQVIKTGGNYVINSGAPSDGDWVARHKPALYTSTSPGFAVITLADDGGVEYKFYNVDKDNGIQGEKEVPLYSQACSENPESPIPVNPNYKPCFTLEDSLAMVRHDLPTSVTVPGGTRYTAGGTMRFFFGDHYRASWLQPVRVPVLDIDTYQGGLNPIKRGGGRQTKSLKFETNDGEKLVFRSVDKDPAGTLALEMRNTVIAEITRDQTSTQHPYGAVPVAQLLTNIDILHATPKVYLLGDDPHLGRFMDDYGNMLGMLEERPQDAEDGRPGTFGADKIYKSFELFDERYDDQDLQIDHREFARARIFDILIGDWSKHEDNWKWAMFEKGKEAEVVRPIPRDRDHAFSQLDGLIPYLASRRWAVPNLEHFGYKIQDVRSLTYQARHMDRLLLSPLSREELLAEAAYIQENIGPEEIREAIAMLPSELMDLSGNTIAKKLERRVQDLETYANEYYEVHARIVDVVGTNKKEHFLIERRENGNTRVTVTDPKGNQAGRILYDRLFFPEETKEIRIYGLGDDDIFEIVGNARQAITIRIIGGPGQDDVVDTGDHGGGRRTLVYERDSDSRIMLKKGGRQVKDWRDELYHYERDAYEYNNYMPIAFLNINSFSGLTLGGGVTYTRRSFTRRDYSSKHTMSGAISTIGNFNLRYGADWHHVLHKWDILADAVLERPAFFNFFFGLGNDSTNDQDKFRDGFNQIRLNRRDLGLTLRRRFRRKSEFTLRTGYIKNETVEIANTILDRERPFYGTDDLDFFYVRPNLSIDLRDHRVFPSKGVRVEFGQEWGRGTGVDFGVTRAAAEVLFSTRRFPITLAGRAGWAATQGRVPFYMLPNIGQSEGLRGFRRNRFTGDGYFYYNTELRSPVAIWRNKFLPVVLGLRFFYDAGYVTIDEQPTPDFKTAYGTGFYVIPLSRSYTFSVLFGFSEEESGIIDLNIGTNF